MINLNKARDLVHIALGKKSNLKKSIEVNHQWLGNQYGGFYICPDNINQDSIVYSFGIGEDISFDEALIHKFGCRVYGFDPTPKSIRWVESRQLLPEFTFLKYGIDATTGFVDFLLPKNDDYVSGSAVKQINVDENKKVSVEMKCLKDIADSLGHQKIDILKIDIEGSEYSVMESILSAPVEIHQILVEIHERFFYDGVKRTKNMISNLEEHGYQLFAVSKGLEELSFIKTTS